MTIQDMQSLFADRGLRCTRQRLAVYEALAKSHEHPTADELYRHCLTHCGCGTEGLSLATVYNTLEALCEAGLAYKLPGAGDNGSARYDAARGAHHEHLHMRDRQTGRVQDLPTDISQRILEAIPSEVLNEIETTLGFKVDQVQIELVGRYDPPSAATRSN